MFLNINSIKLRKIMDEASLRLCLHVVVVEETHFFCKKDEWVLQGNCLLFSIR